MRYTFYSKSTGLIQAPTIPQILNGATIEDENGSRTPAVFSELLKDGCYWLDILDPSDFDMQIIAKVNHKMTSLLGLVVDNQPHPTRVLTGLLVTMM